MWIGLFFAGIAGGVLGGMGMGGGTLLIPLLTLALGVAQLNAQAINLIAFAPMAIISLIFHIKNKLVEPKILLFTLPLAVALSVGGAWLSNSIDEATLKKTFGWFMVIIGTVFLIKVLYDYCKQALSDHKADE